MAFASNPAPLNRMRMISSSLIDTTLHGVINVRSSPAGSYVDLENSLLTR